MAYFQLNALRTAAVGDAHLVGGVVASTVVLKAIFSFAVTLVLD